MSSGNSSEKASGEAVKAPLGIWIAPEIKPLLSTSSSSRTSSTVAPSSSTSSTNFSSSIDLAPPSSSAISISEASDPKRKKSLSSQAGVPPAKTFTLV